VANAVIPAAVSLTRNLSGSHNAPGFALPLVVAVTGHRDLIADEIPHIRQVVTSFLQELSGRYPAKPLLVVTALAEGADMLVAEVALELGIEFIVPLPKPRDAYLQDFLSDEGREQFRRLSAHARTIIELDCTIPPAANGFDTDHWNAAFPYANLGVYLCSHCHVLLAIWDGESSSKLGGTANVVRFHQEDVMPGFTPSDATAQHLLMDDESDLVFHIRCSRSSHSSVTAGEVNAIDWYWLTQDKATPRSKELSPHHALIFQRSAEFSADAQRFQQQISSECYSLISGENSDAVPIGASEIDHCFGVADWLAIHYQKLTLRSLAITHVMAFLMGFVFILYSDLESVQTLLGGFLIFFGIAFSTQLIAKRGAWHRKYLDYRTLAEGLRVQFYWAVAGVSSSSKWKFTHDNYFQSQNPEFGWIRNVMRVAGIVCDAFAHTHPNGMACVLKQWVGGADSGQLAYFRRQSIVRGRRFRTTERLGNLSLFTSVITVFAFLLAGPLMSEMTANVLTVLMGTTLLLYGVRHGYTYATATKELIKQYEFMLRIFESAHARLGATTTPEEQRAILAVLGKSALDEHSDWILMHRERAVDETEIWRMGS
jgi:hypothetical protein